MSKILYISNFDNSGYGVAARENVIAMATVGLDVSLRHVNLNNSGPSNHSLISALLKKPADDCSICIQHTLPTLFDYSGRFDKNILLFALETNELPFLWHKYCKLPDQLWVINEFTKHVIHKTLYPKQVRVVPHPIDLTKFKQDYSRKGPLGKIKEETGCHLFYTIGEFVSRKNYEGLLKAYFTEFTPQDNVMLVIKTSKSGTSPKECKNKVIEVIEYVKSRLKQKYFAPIYIDTDFLSEQQLLQLHYDCDCFISCSHGEAWNLPLADALGFNKSPIVSGCMGHLDVVSKNNSFICGGYDTPCYDTPDFSEDIYSSKQSWFSVSINEVKKAMRLSMGGGEAIRKRKYGLSGISQFSYERVGKIIKQHLNL